MSSKDTNEWDRLITGPMDAGPVRRGEVPRPGIALVFSLDDGEPVVLARRPSLWESPRYHYRYEVDTTDHDSDWQEELPSGTSGFAFSAEIHTRWRVSAPEKVVRRSVTTIDDGARLVRAAVAALLRSKLKHFDIEDFSAAEESASHALRSQEHVLDCGISVVGCTLHLVPGRDALEHIRRRRESEWQKEADKQDHGREVQRTHHEAQVTELRAEALRAAARGEGGLLLHLIAQDPSQLRSILQEVAERQDIALERKQRILQDFVANDLLLPADVSDLAARLIEQPLPFGNDSNLAGPRAPQRPPLPGVAMPPHASNAASPSSGAVPSVPPPSTTRGQAVRGTETDAAPATDLEAGPGDGVVGWKPVGTSRRSAAPGDDEDA